MPVRRRWWVDAAIALSILALAGSWASSYLVHNNIFMRPDTQDDWFMLIPALMFATGHGLSGPDSMPPAMQEFLEQKTDELPAGIIPRDMDTYPLYKVVQDRPYLTCTVGLAWRMLGLSWWSVRVLMGVVYGIVGCTLYLLFRLGINRAISLACTLLSLLSPVMLAELPWIRSFFRVPFILLTLLIAGCILVHRLKPYQLLLLAALQGFIIGVGIGFRQDSIIGLPIALAAVTLVSRGVTTLKIRYRVIACALLLVCFLIPAYPILSMNVEGGNTAFYLLQGFARGSVTAVDTQRPFYCALSTDADPITHATIDHYDYLNRRAAFDRTRQYAPLIHAQTAAKFQLDLLSSLPELLKPPFRPDQLEMWSHDAEMSGRKLVLELYAMFPGDVITRGYAATLRCVRGLLVSHDGRGTHCDKGTPADSIEWMLGRHLNMFGPVYAAVSLLILAAIDLRFGFGCLILLLYFCGYTSLEFQTRHAFHLNFVSFWFPGFLLSLLCGAAVRFSERSVPVTWSKSLARAGLFAVVSLFLLCVPLHAARAYQSGRVEALFQKYRTAELESVPYREEAEPGTSAPENTFYCPLSPPAFDTSPSTPLGKLLVSVGLGATNEPEICKEYFVAEVETAESPSVHFAYRKDVYFDGNDSYELPENKPTKLRFFFPAYKFSGKAGDENFPEFKGVRVGHCRFVNLYRVKNINDFPILMSVWLPDEPEQARRQQTLMFFNE